MKKQQVILDLEVYPGYFLANFMRVSDGKCKSFELHEDNPELDVEGIKAVLSAYETITFNGNHYDIPVLSYALVGASNAHLKAMSDALIVEDIKPWLFAKNKKFDIIKPDHIDLKELCIGKSSLKTYGGRLHLPVMRDLPLDTNTFITADMRADIKEYCKNDCRVTAGLLKHLEDQINLRRSMSDQYGVDLRSKSDAQIAEAVIRAEVFRMTGKEIKKKHIGNPQTTFKYDPPAFVRFATDDLKQLLEEIKETTFEVASNGQIQEPKCLNRVVTIGNVKIALGLGGAHSREESRFVISDCHKRIIDKDVNSFYPQILINQGLAPPQVGEEFKEVFKSIVERRLEAKKCGDKTTADTLKICVNGTFGKTNSIYSFLYAPKMMIQTTVTGQLAICMLVEKLWQFGIETISVNTDGIVIHVENSNVPIMNEIVRRWENLTGYTTEETEYKALYNRDVNSYIAIKPDGKIKTKGLFASPGLAKNPQNYICTEAVIEYVTNGTPIEDTIYKCKDITKFITLRNIKGGGQKNGEIFPKNVRWYYAVGDTTPITYISNGNAVATSKGGKPCMNLPEEFPDDIDYEKYVKIAKGYLVGIGVLPQPPKLPRKNSKEWKQLLADGKIEESEEDGKFQWVET